MFSKATDHSGAPPLATHVCSVAPRGDWAAVRGLSYLLDDERAVFVLHSQREELVFTTHGIIHLDGFSLVSKKVHVHCLRFALHPLTDVHLHVAGVVTADAELIFAAGPHAFRVDVAHRDLGGLTALFKALLSVAARQARSPAMSVLSTAAIDAAAKATGRSAIATADAAVTISGTATEARAWLAAAAASDAPQSFEREFETYLRGVE